MATLATYLAQVRRLLHDPNDTLWSEADKTAYINEGLKQRDLDSGGQRSILSVTLTAGDDTYLFSDAAVGNTSIFDVVAINLIYNGLRVVLDMMPKTQLDATYRVFQSTYRDRPAAWCRFGSQGVIFGPVPALAYVTEWDCVVFSADLVASTDADQLPYPYTQPVPYYAAYLAKINEQQQDEAQLHLEKYQYYVNAINAVRTGMVPSMYPGRL